MDMKAVGKMLLKYVDIRALVIKGLVEGLIEPFLVKLAQKSDNTLDDMLVQLILVELKKYLNELADDKLVVAEPEPAA